MSDKTLKSKEERIIEMYIKDYITKTKMYEMLKRVENEKEKGK